MLTVALWFGIVWQHVAPLAVRPGMPSGQAHTLLGSSEDWTMIYGPPDKPAVVKSYSSKGVTVCYYGGKVQSVRYHEK